MVTWKLWVFTRPEHSMDSIEELRRFWDSTKRDDASAVFHVTDINHVIRLREALGDRVVTLNEAVYPSQA